MSLGKATGGHMGCEQKEERQRQVVGGHQEENEDIPSAISLTTSH
jgi:hypothetical protein